MSIGIDIANKSLRNATQSCDKDKIQALAKFLDVDPDEIDEENDNLYVINPHQRKEGHSPEHYIKTIKEFKKLLDSKTTKRITYFLKHNIKDKKKSEKLYNNLKHNISSKPEIKGWGYNINILFHLFEGQDWNGSDVIQLKLKKAWFDEKIKDDRETVWANEGEYLVLDDEEADAKAKEEIEQSIWAFNAEFIISHCKADIPEDVIKVIQDKYESGNDTILQLIDDFDEFVEDAISADGRGHFINYYDGTENEIDVDGNTYYIYKQN